jgi:rhamnosyl/mannosyltransferase
MRILQLGKFFPVRGGVEKVMYDLTEGLSARGIACDMLCSSLRGLPGRIKDLPGGGRVICIKPIAKIAGTMIVPGMSEWLKVHCMEYDIIHVHHPDPMAALALRRSGYRGRVILHWHSDILKQKFFLTFYKPLLNWLIRRADTIVGTSPVYIKESPWLQKVQEKCTYVPIGIDPVETTGSEVIRGRFPGRKIVLSIGRLIPYKGYEYLIEAAKYLPDDYRVIIGGTGPLQDTLERQIAESGLEGKVSLEGYIKDGGTGAYYGAADVFVMSSTMKTEAFGIVQIEAMSCGLPVVSTRIPASGVAWVNKDGESGLTVEPRNARALAEAVLAVCADPAPYREGARKRYEALFTKEEMIKKITEIYGI